MSSGFREHYLRDAQGNVMAMYKYAENGTSLQVTERPVYGSSRLGSYTRQMELVGTTPPQYYPYTQPMQAPLKRYELTDHLGNVATVVTGRLLPLLGPGMQFQAEVVSAQGYEAFGALLPGRNYSSDVYRFGFNGQEKDDEVHGSTGTSYDFGARMHDPRVGRFLSLDPFASAFAFQSPHLFAGNNPIQFIDHNGQFKLSKKLQKQYPLLTNVLVAISNDANNNPQSALVSIFMERTGASREQALNILTWKSGPKVGVGRPEGDASAHTSMDGSITINKAGIKRLHEEGLPDLNKAVGLYWAFITMWHEGGHAGDLALNGIFTDEQIGSDGLPKGILDIGGNFDIGVRMERDLGLPAELYNDATKTRTLSFIDENTSLSIEPFGILNQGNILDFFGRNKTDQRAGSTASEPAGLYEGLPLLLGREHQGDTP